MSDIQDHEAIDAFNVYNHASSKKTMEDLREAVYKNWIEADTEEAREKLHGIATGAEMFWRIMERYATKGKMVMQGLDDELQRKRQAID
jgi:hypothetical protein